MGSSAVFRGGVPISKSDQRGTRETRMNTSAQQTPTQAANETNGSRKGSGVARVVWAILSLFVALLATGVYLPPHTHLAVFALLLIWWGGALLGYLGARLGDAVRRIARPNVIMTTDGVSDALWARICWGIGPQTVGLFLGSVTGTSILVGWVV